MTWRSDDAFTLPELLVAVVILGVVSSALTGSIIIGLKVTDDTSARVKESTDAQLASAYFAWDAQSATDVATAADPGCAIVAGASAIVSFTWEDPAEPTVPRVATWFTHTVDGERHLSRRFCDGGSGTTVTLSRALGPAGPELTCPGGCSGTPSRVEMAVTELSGYSFRLSGTRRSAT